MNVHVDKRTESIIEEKIKRGQFADATGAIQEAVRQMDERDQRLEELRAALAVGEAQIERGEVVEWTPTLIDDIFAEAKRRHAAGVKPKADVTPEGSIRGNNSLEF